MKEWERETKKITTLGNKLFLLSVLFFLGVFWGNNNKNNTNQNKNKNRAEQKNTKTNDNTKPANKIKTFKKNILLSVGVVFLWFLLLPKQPKQNNKTTIQQNNQQPTKTTTKNKKQATTRGTTCFLSFPFVSNDCTLKIDGLTSWSIFSRKGRKEEKKEI